MTLLLFFLLFQLMIFQVGCYWCLSRKRGIKSGQWQPGGWAGFYYTQGSVYLQGNRKSLNYRANQLPVEKLWQVNSKNFKIKKRIKQIKINFSLEKKKNMFPTTLRGDGTP